MGVEDNDFFKLLLNRSVVKTR